MSQQAVDDRLIAARDAARRHAWQEAYEPLLELDREQRLDGESLELLGDVAWWAGRPDASVAARERAFAAYLNEGNRARAGYMAILAARDHHEYLSHAVAQGWQARAARILEDEPEGFAHGYLLLTEIEGAIGAGDFDRGEALAARAVDIGSRYGDKDLQGYGLMFRGVALVRRGDIESGLSLLDEATAAAVGSELSAFATGVVYCVTIGTCRDLADYRRAGQWTEVAERWCERQAISGFPGVCRVHRAEILALRGAWTEAEEQALLASKELLSFKAMFPAAEGYYAVGEIRLRMGDLAGAEEAFREAHALGREPQPGLALLYLAQGRVDAAFSSIQRALSGAPADRLSRARMLPAQVEIAIEAGELDTAQAAAEELGTIANEFGSPALRAAAQCARGMVLIATNEAEAAIAELNQARTEWQAADVPYEVARARVALSNALRLRGHSADAALELDTACASFRRLGASPDASRCERLLEELRAPSARGARQRRTFVFTDIVGSTELIGVIGDDGWEDLVRWHDETLRGLAAKHGGEEVHHAGDGFFLAFQDADSAIDCAIGIQQALAAHRRSAGFAPRVRIGLHADEATKVGDDYLGQGVHEAARIGALAGAGEILASADTVEGLERYRLGDPRSVELKGIGGSIQVRAIDWRAPGA